MNNFLGASLTLGRSPRGQGKNITFCMVAIWEFDFLIMSFVIPAAFIFHVPSTTTTTKPFSLKQVRVR
jgi:hypothetical protein